MATKQERLEHANQLIRIIGSHGRRFFYYHVADRYARMELRNGRVYFIDDYSDRAIYIHKTAIQSRWRGFSHGGTLRSLVEDMRDYIVHGTRVPAWKIVIQQRSATGLDGNIWGYDVASAQAVRDAAYQLPIVGPRSNTEGCEALMHPPKVED